MSLLSRLSLTLQRRLGITPTRLVDHLAGIPLLHLLALTHRRPRPFPTDIRRIGVLCSPTTGDTVLFSAILLDLRAHFGPAVEITHLIGSKNRAAADLLSGANHRLLLDLTHPLAAARLLRAQHFDLLLDFSSWQRITALLTVTSLSRYTVGFRSPGQHRHPAFDRAIPHRRDQHELENFRDLLRALAIPALAQPALTVPDAPIPTPWQQSPQIIVLHPWPAGGPASLRQWPETHWAELARRLSTPNTLFAITGAPSELPASRAFAARLASSAHVQALAFEGEGGLLHLVRLLRRAYLVVSVNTGIMHLAAVAGAPTVSLNGPTSGLRWGPIGPCCVGVSPADGSGGYLHFGFELDPRQPDVMPRIDPAHVAATAHALLERCGRSGTSQTSNFNAASPSPPASNGGIH